MEYANTAPYDEGVYSLLDTTVSFNLGESVGITKNGIFLVASFYLLACESGPAPTPTNKVRKTVFLLLMTEWRLNCLPLPTGLHFVLGRKYVPSS